MEQEAIVCFRGGYCREYYKDENGNWVAYYEN